MGYKMTHQNTSAEQMLGTQLFTRVKVMKNDQLKFPSSLFTQLAVVFLRNVYLGVQG